MEQHDLRVNVDARGSETGLRRFDEALARSNRAVTKFSTEGQAAFRALAQAASQADFSSIARRASEASRGISQLGRMTTEMNRLATASRSFSGTFATEMGKVRTAANDTHNALRRLPSSLEPLAAMAPRLATLAPALRQIGGALAGLNVNPTNIANVGRAVRILANASGAGNPFRLAALGVSLRSLSGIRIDPAIGTSLMSIARAGSAVRVGQITALVAPLRELASVRIPASTGNALVGITRGLDGLRSLTPSRVNSFRDLVATLRNMPTNLQRGARSLGEIGVALGNFRSFSASTGTIQRFFNVLAQANPAHITSLAAALRQLAHSGIHNLRIPNISSLSVPRAPAGGFGGGGGGMGGLRGGVSLPVGLGAFSVSSQLGGAVAAGAGALSIGSLISGISSAGQAIDQFKLKMAATAQSTGEVAAEWEFLKKTAFDLAMPIDMLTEAYGKFQASMKLTGVDMETGQNTFLGFAQGFRAMGMNGEQIRWALKALEQMATKNQVMAEELRSQLGEHFPGAIQLMAESMGWTTRELQERMKDGQVGFDAVIKMGEHVGQKFGGATAYSLNTAAAAAQNFQSRMFLLAETVFNSGFEEGLKGMFDEFFDIASDPSAEINARKLGEAFKWGFEQAGNAARWLADHIEGVKLAIGGFLALSGVRIVLGLASALGSAAAGALGLGSAFRGIGLTGLIGGLATVATRFTIFGTLAWGAYEVLKQLNIGTIDWKNGLVEIDGQMYTFAQTAQAAMSTIQQFAGNAWEQFAPSAGAAMDDVKAQWETMWSFMQTKSAEGGGGVTGFFKQMSIDAIGYIRSLDPEFFAGMDRIADYLRNGSDNPIAKSYRDVMNNLIGVTKFTFKIIEATIKDMLDRAFAGMGNLYEMTAGILSGDLDRAYNGAMSVSRGFVGLVPGLAEDQAERKERFYGDIYDEDYLNTDYLRQGFEAVETGAAALETGARNMETQVVETFEQLSASTEQILQDFATLFLQNLGAASGMGLNGTIGTGSPAGPELASRQDYAYQYFIGAGLSPAQAAALVGNLTQESNINPNAHNDTPLPPGHAQAGQPENSYGIMQWREGRFTALKEFAAANGTAWNDLNTQLAFAIHEMKTSEANKVGAFMSATDVAGANAGLKPFIRYGDDSLAARGQYANDVYQRNIGQPRDAMGAGFEAGRAEQNAFQQGKQQALDQIEATSAGSFTPPEAPLPNFNATELTYEQWKRVDEVIAGIQERTGQLTVSELEYRNAVNQVVGEKLTAYDIAMSQQKSEQMLAGLTAEERERELALLQTRNAALKESEQMTSEQVGNLRTQVALTQDLAKEQERLNAEADKWKKTFEDRQNGIGMTATLSDWRNADTASMASSLQAAQGDPQAMALAMDSTRKGLFQETDPYERMMQSMRDEYELANMTNIERGIETELLAQKNALLEQGVVMTADQEAATRSMISEMKRLEAGGTNGFASWLRGAEDFNVALAKVEQDALDGLIDKMTDFITTGKADWQELSNEIIRSITKVALNELVKQFLTGSGLGGQQNGLFGMAFNAGGMMGGGGQAAGAAGGNIFQNMFGWIGNIFGGFKEGGYSTQPVTSYGVSDVFTHAPRFKYGGITGDGGIPAVLHDDEAVIPLSRNRRIPVQLTGDDRNADNRGRPSNVTIVQNITTKDAPSFRKSQRQVSRDAHRAGQRAIF